MMRIMIFVRTLQGGAVGALALSLFITHELTAHEDWNLSHHWALNTEFVYMNRTLLQSHTIVDQVPQCVLPCQNLGVLRTNKLIHEFHFEPGFRVGLGYRPDRRWSLEGNFLYLNEWHGKKERHGNGTLSYPFHDSSFTNDFVNADRAEAKYRSRFYSAEANYWGHFTPRRADYFSVSWVFGLRYINLHEWLKIAFTKITETSNYNVQTRNLMGGPQIGGCFEWNPTEQITWNFTAKFAPLLDRAEQHTFLGDRNNTITLRDFTKKKWNPVFLADVAASFNFQITPHFNLHAGYEMIYLTGLALAPEQLNNSSSFDMHKHVKTSGNALIHGLFTGLIFTF
ncbi:MAG: autotransporter outer membrane beta-barrel domain-containing protein [Chlamydiales bacterium]